MTAGKQHNRGSHRAQVAQRNQERTTEQQDKKKQQHSTTQGERR